MAMKMLWLSITRQKKLCEPLKVGEVVRGLQRPSLLDGTFCLCAFF